MVIVGGVGCLWWLLVVVSGGVCDTVYVFVRMSQFMMVLYRGNKHSNSNLFYSKETDWAG